MMSVSIHNTNEIKVVSHYPSNCNSITVQVKTHSYTAKDEEIYNITLYDLPKEVTDKLMEAFGQNAVIHEDSEEENEGDETNVVY